MQRTVHTLNEVLPECFGCQDNSLADMVARVAGRVWRGYLHVTANNENKIINLFKVHKTVLITNQWMTITGIDNLTNCTNVYATLWDGIDSIDITADGIDLSGLEVGTTFFKDKEPAQPYSCLAANGAIAYEPTEKKEGQPFYVQQKNDADTFVRLHMKTNTILNFTLYMEFAYKLFNGANLIPMVES